MNFLNELNDKQREAASQIEGPVLIIAGAGSGKTKTITCRIANMIANGANPQNILAVTFTNKAANEMKERVQKLLQSVISHKLSVISYPFVGTFHSFCVRFLREELSLNFVIYDSDDQLSLIKNAMKELEINDEQIKPASARAAISAAKNEMADAKEYEKRTDGYWQETVAKIFKKYEEALINCNALDFDDLLVKTAQILESKPDILKKWQERYKYITVDEYQDTNFAQYKIVNLLAQKYKNLCVVGDDQQSIYMFRGADFRNILNFEKDYPAAKVIILEENYRSTKNILDAANKVISKNTLKKDKNLWTQKEDGALIEAVLASNERQEADFTASEIKKLAREQKLKLSQCCVMYRTNAQSRAIEESLLKNNLPYQLIGGLKFYERKEIKDILAYLRITFNSQDKISIQRVINVPTRGVGKYEKIYGEIVSGMLIGVNYGDSTSIIKNKKLGILKEFANLINVIANEAKQSQQNISTLLKNIIDKTKYIKYIKEDFADAENRIENINELFSVAAMYDTMPLDEAIKSFLENASLASDTDEINEQSDKVQVMTVHSSKGLEFDAVFVAGLEEGIFPHSRSALNPAELEEERRLCYVALTRAKRHLYLLFAQKRRLWGGTLANSPSRFLFDIPQELVSFRQLEGDDGGLLEIEY